MPTERLIFMSTKRYQVNVVFCQVGRDMSGTGMATIGKNARRSRPGRVVHGGDWPRRGGGLARWQSLATPVPRPVILWPGQPSFIWREPWARDGTRHGCRPWSVNLPCLANSWSCRWISSAHGRKAEPCGRCAFSCVWPVCHGVFPKADFRRFTQVRRGAWNGIGINSPRRVVVLGTELGSTLPCGQKDAGPFHGIAAKIEIV
jgi:hypothetical protein